jgi:hypothetical protein
MHLSAAGMLTWHRATQVQQESQARDDEIIALLCGLCDARAPARGDAEQPDDPFASPGGFYSQQPWSQDDVAALAADLEADAVAPLDEQRTENELCVRAA